jgi:hypothetical protein
MRSKFARYHAPGQGVGYTPPMDQRIFNWLVLNTTAIIILLGITGYTLSRIGF